jgi:DNA helicase-2/ATP-dependent DNA helicase PcrA
VADDDQAIYQWRGSDVSNMLEFAERYSATPLLLSINRRSRPTIIGSANTFAASISPRLPKKMETHRSAEGPEMHAWSAETVEAEAEVIADTIEKLHLRGYRYKDVAILFRSVRTSSPPLIEEFKTRGIPFRCAGRTGLFLQPEAMILGKTYAWLSKNEWKKERYGQSHPVDLDSLLAEFEAVYNAGQVIDELREYLTDWKGMVGDTAGQANLVRDFYKLLRVLGVQELDLDDPSVSARMGCLARFSQILADYEHVTRRSRYIEENNGKVFRGGQDRGTWYYQRLFNYLQYYALDAYEIFEGEDTFDLDAVDILTIHQSKGLEWPVVFLPGLVEGRFPSKFAGQSQDWLIDESVFTPEMRRRYEGGDAEERRLFYVAMTRARDMLYLSRFLRKQNQFKCSPFLREVAGHDPAVTSGLPLSEPFTPPPDEPEELPTISFSELALFEGCPLRYRYSSSLGFQPQLVTELGYGRAIHHILRHVAETTKKQKIPPTPAQVDSIFQESFYLPFANNAAFDSLLKRARALVDTYLTDYSADLLRIWQTERPFELHLAKGTVNGRADVILDREKGKIGRLNKSSHKGK